MQTLQSCPNCGIVAKCIKRDFSEQAWSALLVWGEIEEDIIDRAICDHCYNELRDILSERVDEISDITPAQIEYAREMCRKYKEQRAKALEQIKSQLLNQQKKKVINSENVYFDENKNKKVANTKAYDKVREVVPNSIVSNSETVNEVAENINNSGKTKSTTNAKNIKVERIKQPNKKSISHQAKKNKKVIQLKTKSSSQKNVKQVVKSKVKLKAKTKISKSKKQKVA